MGGPIALLIALDWRLHDERRTILGLHFQEKTVFKDLRTSTKLFILCAMFMIAIGVTTYGLFREKLIAIEFARKELVGTKYLAVARGIFASLLSGRPFDASAAPSSDALGDTLKNLAMAQGEAAATLQTAEPAQALTNSLQVLSSKIESGAAHASALNVLADAQKLATRIADDSNLTLDPDLDSYYVQNLVANKLPTFLKQLGEVYVLASEMGASNAPSNEQAVRFQFLAGQLDSTADDFRKTVAAAYRGNSDGSLKRAIDGPIATMLTNASAYLRGSIPSLASSGVAADGTYSRAVQSAIGAWAAAQLELDRLLQKRIDGLLERMRLSLALTAALVALSILVAVMTHWHVVRPLKRLENVASSVRDTKDYSLRIDYRSKDEIGSLVSAFNTMLAELAAAHERERSEQSELARVARLTTMGAMTASIAHEINQPLAAIVANSNAAQRFLSITPPDLDEVRGALKDIAMDGQRASQVIGSVRAIFKKESQGKGRLAVNDVIEDILTVVRGEIRKHGLVLRTDLHPDLPHVEADRTQIQQVILNLIMNAVEAMAPLTNGDRLLVVRSDLVDARNVIIKIEDSGPGFNPSDKERIFEAFYTTKSEGMGMGLFICRSIVEAHGGRLWASPGAHCGSVLHVVLPSSQ
jgi:signal transduction histidine kinase